MKATVWCIALLFAGNVPPVFAQHNHPAYQPWSLRFDIGGNIPNNPSLTLYDGPVTGGDSLDLSAGVQFDFAVGYRMSPWLKLEGEMGFSYNDVNSVGDWSYRNSSLSQASFMANLVFEPSRGRLVPFAGVGAGGVLSTLSFGSYYYYYYNSSDGYGTDFVPAAQAFAGLRYYWMDNASFGLTYRFLVTDSLEWDVNWWDGRDFTIGVDSITSHSICLVFSYEF